MRCILFVIGLYCLGLLHCFGSYGYWALFWVSPFSRLWRGLLCAPCGGSDFMEERGVWEAVFKGTRPYGRVQEFTLIK